MIEWNKDIDINTFVSLLRTVPVSFFDNINPDKNFIVTDNRQYNEYFFISDLNFERNKKQ